MAVRRRPARGTPGQHFLRTRRLATELVADAGVGPGDLIVEIGGGSGVLTQALADTGARLIVIERDPALADQLRRRFEGRATIEIVEGDAAEHKWPAEGFAVVANLPFDRSGTILAHLLRDPLVPLRQAYVIVQWEFGAKHTAVWPATLRSTYWRAWYDISIASRLARTAFSPPPSVDSAVLRLERRLQPRVSAELHEDYRRFLEDAFAGRRPMRHGLRPFLSPLQVKRLAPTLGFDPRARAWDLDARQWAGLFRHARSRAQAADRHRR